MNTESMNKTDKNLIYLVIFLFAAFGLISVIHLAAGSKVLSGPMFQKGDCIISKPSENIEKWDVDTNTPDKILTVSGENLDPEKVKETVKNAGFIIKGEVN